MIVVVKEIIELFKVVKRKKELYQKILVFSILHNYSLIRIYNYYSIFKEDKAIFYCYSIDRFDFIARDNKEK